LPIWGFNENTKKAIKARNADGGEDEGMDYCATSPHAAYDTNRNKRALSVKANKDQDDG